ncbi:unnamed protein product [Arctogadus glacialis]
MILSKMTGNWGDFEVRELLALRALDEIHRHITGTVKDGPVLEKLARMHRERGYSRTKAQVMSKLKNLRRKFHQVNNYNGKTGRGRLDWTYFDLCQAIWGESSLCADPSVESGPLSDTDASSTRGESASNDQPEKLPKRRKLTKAPVLKTETDYDEERGAEDEERARSADGVDIFLLDT